jgi:hypothetical protein
MLPGAHASCEGFATRNALFYSCRAELSTGTTLIFVAGCHPDKQKKPGRAVRGQTPVLFFQGLTPVELAASDRGRK